VDEMGRSVSLLPLHPNSFSDLCSLDCLLPMPKKQMAKMTIKEMRIHIPMINSKGNRYCSVFGGVLNPNNLGALEVNVDALIFELELTPLNKKTCSFRRAGCDPGDLAATADVPEHINPMTSTRNMVLNDILFSIKRTLMEKDERHKRPIYIKSEKGTTSCSLESS